MKDGKEDNSLITYRKKDLEDDFMSCWPTTSGNKDKICHKTKSSVIGASSFWSEGDSSPNADR